MWQSTTTMAAGWQLPLLWSESCALFCFRVRVCWHSGASLLVVQCSYGCYMMLYCF